MIGDKPDKLAIELGMSPAEVHAAAKRACRTEAGWFGMPTACAAEPLSSIMGADGESPAVWPDPEGRVWGESFSPLYKSVPVAAMNDSRLHELLVLVDAIRGGDARERVVAVNELKQRLEAGAMDKGKPEMDDQDRLLVGGTLSPQSNRKGYGRALAA